MNNNISFFLGGKGFKRMHKHLVSLTAFFLFFLLSVITINTLASSDGGNGNALVTDGTTQPAAYQWGLLADDSEVYTDRNFTYTTIPDNFQNLDYLRTANDDKTGTSDSFLSFDVKQAVTVYVAFDERRDAPRPAWLRSWRDTKEMLITSDVDVNDVTVTLRLYAKDYAAGTVTLGGNQAEDINDKSMYTVIIETDKVSPEVVAVRAGGDPTIVKVEYNEVVTADSAENSNNYSIASPDIPILTAELNADGNVVTLTINELNALSEGVNYTLTVNNVADTAAIANVIALDSQTSFTYSSALVIDNIVPGTNEKGKLAEGSQVYSDRGFTYNNIPPRLKDWDYLRTVSTDRAATLSFDVNQPVAVFVAYDERNTEIPEWLFQQNSWTDTGEVLLSSDGARLRIYVKNYEAGTVNLGSNQNEDNSMYTVIILSQKDAATLPLPDTTPAATPATPATPNEEGGGGGGGAMGWLGILLLVFGALKANYSRNRKITSMKGLFPREG